MYYSVLNQWLNQRIEWTPSCTRLRLVLGCDLHICSAKGHFRLNRDLMKGLLLMTDNSCNKFRYRILNDNKKEILLKTIKAVHRFGIRSSVWCRAKIFDLDQAAFRSGCAHCSFTYESFPIEMTLWHLRPAETRSTCASAQSMYRGSLIWVYAYRQQNALCQQAV